MGAAGDTLTGMGGGDVFAFQPFNGNQTISDFHQGPGAGQAMIGST